MCNKDKIENKSKGLTIPGKHLFGDANTGNRKGLLADGAVWDYKDSCWICPNEEVYKKYIGLLGLNGSKAAMPNVPAITVPMPATEKSGVSERLTIFGDTAFAQASQKVSPITQIDSEQVQIVSVEVPIVSSESPIVSLDTSVSPIGETPIVPVVKPAVLPMIQVSPAAQPEAASDKSAANERILALPPSIVVVGEISKRGDIHYETLDENENITEESTYRISNRVKTTRKIVTNVEEREQVEELERELRGMLRGICHTTVLGPVCSVAKEAELDVVISEARRRAVEFNAKAQHHHIKVGWIKATIAPADARFAKEITLSIQETMEELRKALEAANPRQIRDVINSQRARELVRSVPNGQSKLLAQALDTAREAARKIVKDVGEAGKSIETVKKELNLAPFEQARMTFLEYTPPDEIVAARSSIEAARFVNLETANTPEVKAQVETARFKELMSQ